MLAASRDLLVVQVKFGFIGALHPHARASFRSPESGSRDGLKETLTPRLLEQVYYFHQ